MLEIIIAVLSACLIITLLALFVALRRAAAPDHGPRFDELARANERLERELRAAVDAASTQVRMETGARHAEAQNNLLQQLTGLGGQQGQQLMGFGQQLSKLGEVAETSARANREEGGQQLKNFADGMQQQLNLLTLAIQNNLSEVRQTLETRIRDLQHDNAGKLEEMRKTVDERLHATLEARLGESFKLVSERLEQVHRGLGEMQTLAVGVGDLKRVLSNVKTRGTFGEVQLAALLDQVMAPDQYAANVCTRPNTRENVDFAIKMPGSEDGHPMWLPIDAKFPSEDYERLLAAHERADPVGVEQAARAIENAIKREAKAIREKYIQPPYTTDFALLFLPTEGLYAEVLRRPGLVDGIQREQRVIVAGPTTLYATLNSLQMGFRTLALEQRSAEVWQVLGAVKTEFSKFGEVLSKLKTQLTSASNTIDQAETRTRQMTRALKSVEAMPAEDAIKLLPEERSREA